MTEETTQPLPEDDSVAPNAVDKTEEAKKRKRWQEFRQRVENCKSRRKKLIRNWSVNIDYRRGKPFSSQSDDDSISVNLDWSYTKTKQAALFSQVPKVRVAHSPESVAVPWLPAYERRLNDKLVEGGLEAAMDEVLPDCINAAGAGIALVSYEALTQDKQVPAVDLSVFPPHIQSTALQSGMLFGEPIPMETVPERVDYRYTIRRISPADFLWPVDFTGSDFDNAPWLGYSGRITWAEAKSRFRLTDADKDSVLTDEQTVEDRLSHDYDRENITADDGKVGFDEIFYNTFSYDVDAKSYKTIHHLVFLHGKQEPVIDEPWQGQLVDPTNGKIVGSHKKPIRVLTLAYVTDEDLPPSDSAIGRSQVNELNKGRNNVSKQRARSVPASWFDVNRLDPLIQRALMNGNWNGMIPVQGDGTRILGTVQQPAIHQENYLFDKVAKQDLQELWTIGANQLGVGGEVETKGEAGVIQSNFQTKVGRERARVATFVIGIAEVLGGFLALYEDPTGFGEGFDPGISERLSYSILVDSTVLLDSNQRLERLNKYLDTYAKTGWVDVESVLKEITTLIGLDANTVVRKPEPQAPPPPNISLRLSGGEDMMNPLLLAFLLKTGQAPEPELVEKAKQLIQAAVVVPDPMAQQQPQGPNPAPPPPAVGEAMPEASLLPTIGRRAEDGHGPGEGEQ